MSVQVAAQALFVINLCGIGLVDSIDHGRPSPVLISKLHIIITLSHDHSELVASRTKALLLYIAASEGSNIIILTPTKIHLEC